MFVFNACWLKENKDFFMEALENKGKTDIELWSEMSENVVLVQLNCGLPTWHSR